MERLFSFLGKYVSIESIDAKVQGIHTMPLSLLLTANKGYIEQSNKHVKGPRWATNEQAGSKENGELEMLIPIRGFWNQSLQRNTSVIDI
ncbi:MAG: hypothetical protein NTZ87_02900 [Candidatus Nomurabacteria bacterium]|nr:hypothetical protein [Candidatus Nomurabacteria bacterium]